MSDPAANPLRDALDNPSPAPDMAQPGDIGPELERDDEFPAFPPGCPIAILGNQQDVTGKQTIYYLNYNGQLVGLEANNRHGKLGLAALFGPHVGWLEANWGQWSKPQREQGPDNKWVIVKESELVGFDQAKAALALVVEGTRKGIFDPQGRLRGRGAHRHSDGRGLVHHFGDKLLVSQHRADGSIKGWKWQDAGLHERYVYTAAEPIPRPHVEPQHTRPVEKLLQLLMTWNWKRKKLDPRFVLGAIALGPFGGASPWRSHILITGGKGAGKSTLNGKDGVVHRIFGEGVFRTANTSSAGLRQSLRNSTLPVMIDEFEAGKDNAKVQEVIELARIASSGDEMTRGSSDHSAQQFTLQSCFWFSGINMPPLAPQDRSRLAMCELMPFPKDTAPLDLSKFNFPEIGRVLMRRMVDGWHRLEATKLKFHAALSAVGHDPRACDQFGTLLAAADIVLWDHDTDDGLPDQEEVNHWAQECRPQRMVEISEATADHQDCVDHLATSMVQARGGDERQVLATWIGEALADALAPAHLDGRQSGYGKRLEQYGLKLVNARYSPEVSDQKGVKPAGWGSMMFKAGSPGFLAVANSHQALASIFTGTTWNSGVWKQALARVPGSIEGVVVKMGRASTRCVLVPLAAVLDEDELPAESKPKASADWIAAQLQGGSK